MTNITPPPPIAEERPKHNWSFMAIVFLLCIIGIFIVKDREDGKATDPTGETKSSASYCKTDSELLCGSHALKITACQYDDGEFDRKKYDGCYWDAKNRTNGQGYSFISLDNPADSSGEPMIFYSDEYNGPDQSSFGKSSGYDPKDKYLGESDGWNTDTASDHPKGDSPNGPEYNSTETDYFNTYNEQYKNWHHETK